MTHIATARWEVDVYRPTHLLPYVTFWQLGVLARSLLSATSMLIYQVQSGRLDATQLHRQRCALLAVAAAFQDCCTEGAACLESNAPISTALRTLERLHGAFIALGGAAGGAPPETWAHPGSLAFSAWFNSMFAAASRLRKIYRLLPAALARDQPDAVQEAAACFAGMPDWDIRLLSKLEPQRQAYGRDPLAILRESLLSPGASPRSLAARRVGRASTELEAFLQEAGTHLPAAHKEQLLARLSQRSVFTAGTAGTSGAAGAAGTPPERQRLPWLARSRAWLVSALPATEQQLRIALQFLLCFLAVMFLQIVDASYTALRTRVTWAMTIVVVLFEASAGSSIRKGLLRLAGTLMGAAAGIAIYYFTFLCNGLSRDDNPQKFILTSLLLALACGTSAAFAARTPPHTYMQITFCTLATGCSLALYVESAITRPLWQVVMTLIGLALMFVSVSCVFPVTSHDMVQGMMARALGQLASAAEGTIAETIPAAAGSDSVRSRQPSVAQGSRSLPSPSGQQLRSEDSALPGGTLDQRQPSSAGSNESSPVALSGSQQAVLRQPSRESNAGSSQAGFAVAQQPSTLQPSRNDSASSGTATETAGQPPSPQQTSSKSSSPAAATTGQPPRASPRQPSSQRSPGSSPGAGDTRQRLHSAFEVAAAMPLRPAEGKQPEVAAELPSTAAASGPSLTPAASLPPGSEPGTPPAAAPTPPVSVRRRLQLSQQPSLIAIPPDRAILAGSSRAAVLRAVRQLRMPAGPELLAEAEPLLGRVYSRLVLRFAPASSTISSLAPIISTLRFEWRPLARGRPRRFSVEAAFRSQRLCRHVLNVLSSFASSLDAHHLTHVALLAQHRQQVCRIAHQLGECLRSLQAMVQGRLPPASVVGGISSLQRHVERLFLLVLLHPATAAAGGSAEAAQGVAFMAMLFSLVWAVRRLALALACTFHPRHFEDLERQLGDEEQWAVDEELLAAVQAVAGLAYA